MMEQIPQALPVGEPFRSKVPSIFSPVYLSSLICVGDKLSSEDYEIYEKSLDVCAVLSDSLVFNSEDGGANCDYSQLNKLRIHCNFCKFHTDTETENDLLHHILLCHAFFCSLCDNVTFNKSSHIEHLLQKHRLSKETYLISASRLMQIQEKHGLRDWNLNKVNSSFVKENRDSDNHSKLKRLLCGIDTGFQSASRYTTAGVDSCSPHLNNRLHAEEENSRLTNGTANINELDSSTLDSSELPGNDWVVRNGRKSRSSNQIHVNKLKDAAREKPPNFLERNNDTSLAQLLTKGKVFKDSDYSYCSNEYQTSEHIANDIDTHNSCDNDMCEGVVVKSEIIDDPSDFSSPFDNGQCSENIDPQSSSADVKMECCDPSCSYGEAETELPSNHSEIASWNEGEQTVVKEEIQYEEGYTISQNYSNDCVFDSSATSGFCQSPNLPIASNHLNQINSKSDSPERSVLTHQKYDVLRSLLKHKGSLVVIERDTEQLNTTQNYNSNETESGADSALPPTLNIPSTTRHSDLSLKEILSLKTPQSSRNNMWQGNKDNDINSNVTTDSFKQEPLVDDVYEVSSTDDEHEPMELPLTARSSVAAILSALPSASSQLAQLMTGDNHLSNFVASHMLKKMVDSAGTCPAKPPSPVMPKIDAVEWNNSLTDPVSVDISGPPMLTHVDNSAASPSPPHEPKPPRPPMPGVNSSAPLPSASCNFSLSFTPSQSLRGEYSQAPWSDLPRRSQRPKTTRPIPSLTESEMWYDSDVVIDVVDDDYVNYGRKKTDDPDFVYASDVDEVNEDSDHGSNKGQKVKKQKTHHKKGKQELEKILHQTQFPKATVAEPVDIKDQLMICTNCKFKSKEASKMHEHLVLNHPRSSPMAFIKSKDRPAWIYFCRGKDKKCNFYSAEQWEVYRHIITCYQNFIDGVRTDNNRCEQSQVLGSLCKFCWNLGETESSLYFCLQCVYTIPNLQTMSTHANDKHPYISKGILVISGDDKYHYRTCMRCLDCKGYINLREWCNHPCRKRDSWRRQIPAVHTSPGLPASSQLIVKQNLLQPSSPSSTGSITIIPESEDVSPAPVKSDEGSQMMPLPAANLLRCLLAASGTKFKPKDDLKK